MASSALEGLRSAHEDLENIEKAVSKIMLEKHKNQKLAVSVDHCIKYLMDQAQGKSQSVLDLYEDKDGARKEDINMLAGTRPDGKGDVWTNFYDKIKEVKDYHRRFAVNSGMPEVHNSEWFYKNAVAADESDQLFSAEEDHGRRLDLHAVYSQWANLKKLRQLRVKLFREAAIVRLKKKEPGASQEELIAMADEAYEEVDYVSWLKTLDQFHEVPRALKYRCADYADYVSNLCSTLRGTLEKSQPLLDLTKVMQRFEKEFEERWAEGSIQGWAIPTHKDSLYCTPSDKLFTSQGVKKAHEEGKVFKKKVAEMQKLGFEEQKKKVLQSVEEDKKIARTEAMVQRFRELLSDQLSETVKHITKKQSMTVEEMEKDDESDLEDDDGVEIDGLVESDDDKDAEERPIYNPLNLPLGWDGKPIPFWLYKLHGLGIEFKCEICGNYSYWGRRAFEKHFQEWRHAFGMRCLKIPNTAHFKEITKIEDAIMLYDKLKKDADSQTFRPDADVECEDMQGNVMSQKAFEDLRRQGLV